MTTQLDKLIDTDKLEVFFDYWMKSPEVKATLKGDKGDTGEPFTIYRTYPSVAAMNADAANVPEDKIVLISSTDADNGKMYTKKGNSFEFLCILEAEYINFASEQTCEDIIDELT